MMGGYIAPGPDYKYKNINKYTENGDYHLSPNIRQMLILACPIHFYFHWMRHLTILYIFISCNYILPVPPLIYITTFSSCFCIGREAETETK